MSAQSTRTLSHHALGEGSQSTLPTFSLGRKAFELGQLVPASTEPTRPERLSGIAAAATAFFAAPLMPLVAADLVWRYFSPSHPLLFQRFWGIFLDEPPSFEGFLSLGPTGHLTVGGADAAPMDSYRATWRRLERICDVSTQSTEDAAPDFQHPHLASSARERLQAILTLSGRDDGDGTDQSPLERAVEEYVLQYGAEALSAVYRALYEEGLRPDQGAALIESLGVLPKRIQPIGRASLFRASLSHSDPLIRFVAARALLGVRDSHTADALRDALGRESHPDLRRNLTDALAALGAVREPAAH